MLVSHAFAAKEPRLIEAGGFERRFMRVIRNGGVVRYCSRRIRNISILYICCLVFEIYHVQPDIVDTYLV
jgi:hypothetical protein